jgi:hypothetical protein
MKLCEVLGKPMVKLFLVYCAEQVLPYMGIYIIQLISLSWLLKIAITEVQSNQKYENQNFHFTTHHFIQFCYGA